MVKSIQGSWERMGLETTSHPEVITPQTPGSQAQDYNDYDGDDGDYEEYDNNDDDWSYFLFSLDFFVYLFNI